MSYYLRIVPGAPPQAWKIDDSVAVRVGVTNPEGGAGTYFKADPGETIWTAIRRQAPSWFDVDGSCPFHQTVLRPGEFYPRIVRPIDQHPQDAVGWSPSARTERSVITHRLFTFNAYPRFVGTSVGLKRVIFTTRARSAVFPRSAPHRPGNQQPRQGATKQGPG